jgi:hypothetical protein
MGLKKYVCFKIYFRVVISKASVCECVIVGGGVDFFVLFSGNIFNF